MCYITLVASLLVNFFRHISTFSVMCSCLRLCPTLNSTEHPIACPASWQVAGSGATVTGTVHIA